MNIDFRWNVRIPLRDGLALNASVYTPRGQTAAAPSILALTPYTIDYHHDRGVYFAANGYPFVLADVRGRGNSDGSFHPFVHEARDAYDAVEWIAMQAFCNGKVAMWGGSYSGYIQWAAAKERPLHLATIVPAAAPYLGIDFPMRRNILQSFLVRWLMY